MRPPKALRNPYAGELVLVTPAPEMTTSLLTLLSTHARATSTRPVRSTASGSPFAGAVHAKNTYFASLVADATVSGRVTSAAVGWSSGNVHGTTAPLASSPRSSLASNVPLLVHARVGIPRRSRDLTISRPVLPLAPRTTDGDASAGLDSASDAALVCTRRSLHARGRAGADTLAATVACIAQWLPVTSWLTSLLVISNQIQNVSSLRQEPHVPSPPSSVIVKHPTC